MSVIILVPMTNYSQKIAWTLLLVCNLITALAIVKMEQSSGLQEGNREYFVRLFLISRKFKFFGGKMKTQHGFYNEYVSIFLNNFLIFIWVWRGGKSPKLIWLDTLHIFTKNEKKIIIEKIFSGSNILGITIFQYFFPKN